jgi:hypothetical protein
MLIFSRTVRNVLLGIVVLCETTSLLPVTMATPLLFQDLKDVTLSETDRFIIFYLCLRPSNFYTIYFQYSNCHHMNFAKLTPNCLACDRKLIQSYVQGTGLTGVEKIIINLIAAVYGTCRSCQLANVKIHVFLKIPRIFVRGGTNTVATP